MPRIPPSFIDELIARADIVEVIGSRVPLKKAGREYKACCPFHGEKTPSFTVSPDKQFYHCFGCGVHGTALGFLMQYERLPFPEAVEDLAARLGLEVPYEGAAGNGPAKRTDESLYDLMGQVTRFYSDCLARDERAKQYVTQRGLSAEMTERFALGYAPDDWTEVLKRFGGTENGRRHLQEGGLIIERDRGQMRDNERFYDRFRDRIMFPIRDTRGRVIAFGGRIIDQGEPKYLNSPETVLFHKGRELYGLYETRIARAPLKRLLVVEGYMDAVRLHQFGLSNTVATLGTATTAEHLRRIFRLVSEVVFAFDGDRAGRAAAWRALQNALPEAREGREISFLFLPQGEDPDSIMGREGREAFEQRLNSALPLSEYLLQELRGEMDLSHADGRARFAAAARPLIARLPAGVYQELLIGRVAEQIKLSPQRLQELWGQGAGAAQEGRNVPQQRANSGSARSRDDGAAASPRAFGNTSGAARGGASHRARSSAGRGTLVRQAVSLLLHFPELAGRVPAARLEVLTKLEDRGVQFLLKLLTELRAQPAQTTGQVLERWRERPEGERLSQLAARETLVSDITAAGRELEDALNRLLAEEERRHIDRLLEKERVSGLDSEEKLELLKLMSRRAGQTPQPERP